MRIGVDTGGTFTDAVGLDDEGRLRVVKVASTPEAPERAVLAAVRALVGEAAPGQVTHGTTVATNALLERTGGPTALLVTEGFEDVLRLRRHARPDLYALHPEVPAPLVPEALTLGVPERIGADGRVVRPLDEAAVEALVARLAPRIAAKEVRSIAVALIHSTTDGAHEDRLGERLAGLGVPVSLSARVVAEPREYERASTAVIDAYVAPVLAGYLAALSARFPSLRVMQSSGGAASPRATLARPVRAVLSGPAAGVVGARKVASREGAFACVTLDVGGTSTDVSLIDVEAGAGADEAAPGFEAADEDEGRAIAGHPLRGPAVDVRTVGAGGGSVAFVDAGGALRVGPRSAGARPGPACYGRGGGEPTVTDAALALGLLPGAGAPFLDGELALDRTAAEGALGRLGAALGLDALQVADAILRIAASHAARAIRALLVRRGGDPGERTLCAFGGAGGLLACLVADELEMARVLVPPAPGLLCAWGALAADVVAHRERTRITRLPAVYPAAALQDEVAPLVAACHRELDEDGVPRAGRRVEVRCEARLAGQAFALSLPLPADPEEAARLDVVAAFHALHARLRGFADPSRPVETVALRVLVRGPEAEVPPLAVSPDAQPHPAVPLAGHEVRGEGGPAVPVVRALVRRGSLGAGQVVEGPAVIAEYSTSTWVPRGWLARVTDGGSLMLERRAVSAPW